MRKRLTELGKALRKLRIDREMRMKDMAKAMGVSVAFLSAVELGDKTMPMDKLETLIKTLDIDAREAAKLRMLAAKTKQTVRIAVRPSSRDLVTAFARVVHNLGQDDRATIMRILNKDR